MSKVKGRNDPNIDVPAVQNAVDLGGEVVLIGTFSFDVKRPDGRIVLVSKAVAILGEGATIVGGTVPLRVDAKGETVTIERVSFERPTSVALQIRQVAGLRIARCTISDVQAAPTAFGNVAIGVAVAPPPGTTRTAGGERVGQLQIVDNEIDIGGSDQELTLGIFFSEAGVQGNEARIHISGNTVRNTTAHCIDVRNTVGQAAIVSNPVNMGRVGGPNAIIDGIRCLGSGSYLIADNQIVCALELIGTVQGGTNAAGIRLQSGALVPGGQERFLARAVVINNDVTMHAGAGWETAGIELRRVSLNNCVIENRIQGSASAAVALFSEKGLNAGGLLNPGSNTLVLDRHMDFGSSRAYVLIGPGITDTVLVREPRTIEDHGAGTIIIPR